MEYLRPSVRVCCTMYRPQERRDQGGCCHRFKTISYKECDCFQNTHTHANTLWPICVPCDEHILECDSAKDTTCLPMANCNDGSLVFKAAKLVPPQLSSATCCCERAAPIQMVVYVVAQKRESTQNVLAAEKLGIRLPSVHTTATVLLFLPSLCCSTFLCLSRSDLLAEISLLPTSERLTWITFHQRRPLEDTLNIL